MTPTLLMLAGSAAAADLGTDGEIREVVRLISDFPVDAEGTWLGQGVVLEQRIRLGGQADWERLSIGLSGDVLTGPVAGQPWAIPTPADPRAVDQRRYGSIDALARDRFALRRAAIVGQAGPMQLEGGVVTAHWGLGMLVNSGEQFRMFGHTRFGDRLARLRTTAQVGSIPLYLSSSFGQVIEDDLARIADGQDAYQAVLSARYIDRIQAGACVISRTQDEADGARSVDTRAIDLYARVPFYAAGFSWSAAAEVAHISGTTTRSLSYETSGALRLRALGAVGQLEASRDRWGLVLRGGYASGDDDLSDTTTTDFVFDRDLEVGQVLYPEVMGAIGAGTAALLDDAGQPEGAEAVANEGALTRATFASPNLILNPRRWLTVRTGAVFLWGTAPIMQPLYTALAGTPTSHHDLPTTGYRLGTEADWAIGLGAPLTEVLGETIRASLEAQGGHAFLSADLAGSGPSRVDLYTLTGRLTW